MTKRIKSAAEKEMRRFINRKYRKNFTTMAEKIGVSTDQCIADFVMELHREASDVGISVEREPEEFIQSAFRPLQGYDISIEDTDKANEFLGYVTNVMNSVRLWSNHGDIPNELLKMTPVCPENITIVPGSTHAANLLKEGKSELEKMGINLDLESTAAEIPTFTFESGIHGGMKASTKKIYPNDPCPCGSGKKYKKCCGRR